MFLSWEQTVEKTAACVKAFVHILSLQLSDNLVTALSNTEQTRC